MLKSSTILVVDDDQQINRGVATRLKSHGYEVLTAFSAEQGLDLVNEQAPDLMILDIHLPGMSGLELLIVLGERNPSHHIPVIILSASVKDQQRALELGAKYFIQKPFDSENLLRAIQSTLYASVENE